MNENDVTYLWKQLEDQCAWYTDNETQALLGADPTAGEGETGSEITAIKNQARGSIGNLILNQYAAGTTVSSIDEGGAPSSLWDKWVNERMDQKLPIVVKDRKVGIGFMLADLRDSVDGEAPYAEWKVLSPKDTVVISSDRVNSEFGEYALHRYFRREPGSSRRLQYVRTWDSVNEYVWVMDGSSWNFVSQKPHGAPFVPLIGFPDITLSDGARKSLFEMISPALKNERQVAAQLGQLTWFNSIKQIFLMNADEETSMTFEEGGTLTGESLQRLTRSIKSRTGADVLGIPANQNPAYPTSLVQMAEGNLTQVVDVRKDALNRVASLASLPPSVLDPTAYSNDSESWRIFDTAIELDQKSITVYLKSLFKLTDAMEGNVRELPTEISWAPSNQAILAAQGDAVSKYSAAGIPTEWIARYVLKGFTPAAIQELIDSLAEKSLADPESENFAGGLVG